MSTSAAAEEHLRVIRSLMEKATVYRAISAPTALVGGCAGMAAAAVFQLSSSNLEGSPEGVRASSDRLFLICWLSALAFSAAANVYSLHADARRRGEKFVSAGMRAALRSLCPSYLVAGAVTIVFWRSPEFLPVQWMLLYGLGLLATQYFAPTSIVVLGWSFVTAGLVLLGIVESGSFFWWDGTSSGNLAMGVTFGGFHLIYAFCVWPRRDGALKAGNASTTDV